MERHDIWFTAQDGLRLHAVDFAPPAGATGDRLPVLCLPGLTRNVFDFEAFATALASGPAPRRVVVLESRGRGQSARDPNPANYTPAVETADAAALLTAADLPRAIFVGTSRGGILSLSMLVARPQAIAGIVLNDIGPVVEMAGLLRIKGYVGSMPANPPSWQAAGAHLARINAGQFPDYSPEDWQRTARGTWHERPDGRLEVSYDLAIGDGLKDVTADTVVPPLWPLFEAGAKVPMMVIRGALSDILSAATVAEMARRKPDLATFEVARQGHAPVLHRPEVLAAVGAFLARCDATTAAAA